MADRGDAFNQGQQCGGRQTKGMKNRQDTKNHIIGFGFQCIRCLPRIAHNITMRQLHTFGLAFAATAKQNRRHLIGTDWIHQHQLQHGNRNTFNQHKIFKQLFLLYGFAHFFEKNQLHSVKNTFNLKPFFREIL